jgi:hypothetical protein
MKEAEVIDGILMTMSKLIVNSPEIKPGKQITFTLDEKLNPGTKLEVADVDGCICFFVAMPYINKKPHGKPQLPKTVLPNWLVKKVDKKQLHWTPLDAARREWLKDYSGHKNAEYFIIDASED